MKTISMALIASATMPGNRPRRAPEMAVKTFAAAINDALSLAMEIDPDVLCYGLGVDDPKGGYVCVKTVGGQILRVQAAALGTKTDTVLAERLLGDCKGTANLKRASCRVDAEIEPRDVVRIAHPSARALTSACLTRRAPRRT